MRFRFSISVVLFAFCISRSFPCLAAESLISAPFGTSPCFEYVLNAPSQPPCRCVSFYADFIYWQMRSEGLIYAYSGFFFDTPTHALSAEAKAVHPRYHPGFRVGINYALPNCDRWDLKGDYLFFSSHDRASASAPGTVLGMQEIAGPYLIPVYMNEAFGPNAQSARANYRFSTHVVNLDLEKAFLVGKRLGLAPHVGFKGVHMFHDFKIDYLGVVGLGAPIDSRAKNITDFWGWGIRIGLDSSWNICRNLSLLVEPSVSLLWSRTKYRLKETLVTGLLRSSVDHVAFAMTPVFEGFFGLSYETFLCKCLLNIYAGWEAQFYYNLLLWNVNPNSNNPWLTVRRSASLSLSGLTAGASICF